MVVETHNLSKIANGKCTILHIWIIIQQKMHNSANVISLPSIECLWYFIDAKLVQIPVNGKFGTKQGNWSV